MAWGWALVPVGLAFAAGIAIHLVAGALPPWLEARTLTRVADLEIGGPLLGASAVGVASQAVVAALFLAAATAYTRWHPRTGSPFGSYLATALIVAATSELHFLLFPGSYSGLVSSNDLLRLLFMVILLVGIAADIRWAARALTAAEGEVRRLREAELARAALEERGRLAREIHDGLSQHLWLAKLRIEQLSEAPDRPGLQERLAELSELIDTSLTEAQQTVSTMRGGSGRPLLETVQAFAESFSDQRGIRIELKLDESLDDVPPRIGAELLRVIQEALSNVARHADATLVTLALERSAAGLALDVADNGVGFDPGEVDRGFGLTSMRERIDSVGGRFEVRSARSAGTRISVSVPLAV